MRYIDQFVQPKDFEEGVWLSELSDAIETSKGILSVPVPVGKFLLINNLFWLHGRDALLRTRICAVTDASAWLFRLRHSPLPDASVSAKELSGCMIL